MAMLSPSHSFFFSAACWKKLLVAVLASPHILRMAASST